MNTLKEKINSSTLNFIPNACRAARSGFCQIVFSPEGNLRRVQKVHTGGRPNERTTYQIAYEGDYILRRHWHPVVETLYQVTKDDLSIIPDHKDSGFIMGIVSEVMEKVGHFMSTNDKAAQLPTGEAWDGVNTVASDRKKERIQQFWEGVPEWFLSKILAAAIISPSSGLARDWKYAATTIPSTMTKTAGASTFWALQKSDSTWIIHHLAEAATPGEERILQHYSSSPIVKAAKVLFRPANRDATLEVVSWELYAGPINLGWTQ